MARCYYVDLCRQWVKVPKWMTAECRGAAKHGSTRVRPIFITILLFACSSDRNLFGGTLPWTRSMSPLQSTRPIGPVIIITMLIIIIRQ